MLGRSKRRPRQLTISHACEHGEKYLFTDVKATERVDYRDAILLTFPVFLIGLKMGIRFDEVQKVENRHLKVHPGFTGTRSIILTKEVNVKIFQYEELTSCENGRVTRE